MKKVYVYQIGCGAFGKYGFEKLLKISKKYDFVEFNGITEINPDLRNFIKTEAKKYRINLKVFGHTFEMYDDALGFLKKGEVFVYDAGPSELHYSHLLKSEKFGFWHLTEKPPALTREEFKKELELPKKWNCDFIEEENEVVLTAIDYLKKYKLRIKSIEIFRESSAGLEKILGNSIRRGVSGDCISDKLIHEIYMFTFLNISKQEIEEIIIKRAEANYLMIESLDKDNFIDIFGQPKDKIIREVATAQSDIKGIISTKVRGVPFSLYSSWLGISEEGRKINKELKKLTGYDFIREKNVEGMKIPYEDLRLFIINCGLTVIYGEMKNKKLFIRKKGELKEQALLEFEEEQLFRILKNNIFAAANKKRTFNIENIKGIMNLIFDSRDKIENGLKYRNTSEELNKTKSKVEEELNKYI